MQTYSGFHPWRPLIFAPLGLMVILASIVIALVPYWFIFKKAGFSPWLTILMIVPFANLLVLYVVAFSEWRTPPTYPLPPLGGSVSPPPM